MVFSLLAIAVSAATLVYGWTSTDQMFLYVSIGASVVATVFMAVAYSRSRVRF